MNPTALGKSLDRWLRSTDRVVKAYSIHASASTNAERVSALTALGKASDHLEAELKRQTTVSDKAKKEARAKAWLEAFLNNGMSKMLKALFLVVHERAKVAASTTVSQEARYACRPGELPCIRLG